jgi:hypothetical protein
MENQNPSGKCRLFTFDSVRANTYRMFMHAPISFGSQIAREDAAFIGRTVAFASSGRIWTLSIEQALTTRYLRRPNERYLVASLLVGTGAPAKETSGELLPDHTAARVTSIHRRKDGAVELVLAVAMEAGALHATNAA